MRKIAIFIFVVMFCVLLFPYVKIHADFTIEYKYKDDESGVTFVVPTNWEEESFVKERQAIDVKFVPKNGDVGTIIYGSTDIYGQLSEYEKSGYTRSGYNNSVFSKSDIAEWFNTTEDKISIVTYNGMQYYKGELTVSYNESGINLSVTMTDLVCIDNGWMYTFQFGGTDDNTLYKDFESLLNSVKYPHLYDASDVETMENTDPVSQKTYPSSDNKSNFIMIMWALIPVIVIIGVVLIVKRASNKKALEKENEQKRASFIELANSLDKTNVCKNCGQELPANSEYCHICGTKIERGI